MSRCLSGPCKYCNTTVQNYYTTATGDEIICSGCASNLYGKLEIDQGGHLRWEVMIPFTRNDILDLEE